MDVSGDWHGLFISTSIVVDGIGRVVIGVVSGIWGIHFRTDLFAPIVQHGAKLGGFFRIGLGEVSLFGDVVFEIE